MAAVRSALLSSTVLGVGFTVAGLLVVVFELDVLDRALDRLAAWACLILLILDLTLAIIILLTKVFLIVGGNLDKSLAWTGLNNGAVCVI